MNGRCISTQNAQLSRGHSEVKVDHSRSRMRTLQLVGCLLLCAIVGWVFSDPLGPSEFSGGSVTGPLLSIHDVSGYLFVLAVVLTFFYRRAAAAIGLVATLLAVPLYVYFIAPGPFRAVFDGEYSVPQVRQVVWNNGAAAGLACLLIAAAMCLRDMDLFTRIASRSRENAGCRPAC